MSEENETPLKKAGMIVFWVALVGVIIWIAKGIGDEKFRLVTTGNLAPAKWLNPSDVVICTDDRHYVRYEYTIDGLRYEDSDSVDCDEKMSETFEVAYDPAEPSNSVIMFDWRYRQRQTKEK